MSLDLNNFQNSVAVMTLDMARNEKFAKLIEKENRKNLPKLSPIENLLKLIKITKYKDYLELYYNLEFQSYFIKLKSKEEKYEILLKMFHYEWNFPVKKLIPRNGTQELINLFNPLHLPEGYIYDILKNPPDKTINLLGETISEYNKNLIRPYIHRYPDVIGIGSKKCSTSAFNYYMRLHPNFSATDKEYHFFDWYYSKHDKEWYLQQTTPINDTRKVVFEKTPRYFTEFGIPEKMAETLPNYEEIKFILIICDPVKRAYSDWAHVENFGEFDNVTKGHFSGAC